jgi:hypothetical protein
MPWPWLMGLDCRDNFAGGYKHWPWPQKSWAFNSFALTAMDIVKAAHTLFTKTDEWNVDDDKMYTWIHDNRPKIWLSD